MTTILLANDDGIDSPGLAAAAEALMPLGRVVVTAPLHQQTSMGRAYCSPPEARFKPHPLTINGREIEAYSYEGSPAAVVRHALLGLPDLCPGLVVAGINYGENIGFNVTGSGTVGAVLEAASRGIPALAMSLETDIAAHTEYMDLDWSGGIHFTRFFAANILRNGMPPGADALKVEVPADANAETPWKPTRLSPFTYYEGRFANASFANERCDMKFSKRSMKDEPADTDAYAILREKIVAVTALHLDLTAPTPFSALESWAAG